MVAPADDGSTATPPLLVRMKKPLPRAIQLAMAISCRSKSSTTASMEETIIGDHEDDDRLRPVLWLMLVTLPSTCIAGAASNAYLLLYGDGNHAAVDELISGAAGGFGIVAAPVLHWVYMAVLVAAWPHLGLFAPLTPHAAAAAFLRAGIGVGGLAVLPTMGVFLLCWLTLNQTWPLLAAWNFLLGLLVASAVALWLCLLRTYGDAGGEKNKNDDDNCGTEAVVDGLAYLYSRLLNEFAVRFYDEVADADAAGTQQQQQLDADVAALV